MVVVVVVVGVGGGEGGGGVSHAHRRQQACTRTGASLRCECIERRARHGQLAPLTLKARLQSSAPPQAWQGKGGKAWLTPPLSGC
jgi:hypothetical protein